MLKQLNSLTSIDMFSSLGGLEVTRRTMVRLIRVQFLTVARILCLLFCFVVVVFLRFCLKHIICHELLSDQTRQPAPTALTSSFAIFSSRLYVSYKNK